MDTYSDTYRTLDQPSKEALFKDRKSKFYGYAYPLTDEVSVKPIVKALKKKHRAANHVCYAWQLGVKNVRYRANDDGEPNNSAGLPIYGQIQSFGLTNVLVAVVRVFGGTKLGVGGLMNAYRTAAKMALEASPIVEKIRQIEFMLSFAYPQLETVMRVAKQEQLNLISQRLEMDCELRASTRPSEVETVLRIFREFPNIHVKLIV